MTSILKFPTERTHAGVPREPRDSGQILLFPGVRTEQLENNDRPVYTVPPAPVTPS